MKGEVRLCHKGHEKRLARTGMWICSTCLNENARARRRRLRGDDFGKRKQAVMCRRGHLFTKETTYVRPSDGARACVTCRKVTERRRHRRARAALGLGFGEHIRPKVCARGHPFTKENTYIVPGSGAFSCRICTRAYKSSKPFACGHARIPKNTRTTKAGMRICGLCRRKTHCKRGHSYEVHGSTTKAAIKSGGRVCMECRRVQPLAKRDAIDALFSGEDPDAVRDKYEAMGYGASKWVRAAVALINDKRDEQQWLLGRKRMRIVRRRPECRKDKTPLGAPRSPTRASRPERTSRT